MKKKNAKFVREQGGGNMTWLAKYFAIAAHEAAGQVRKYSGEPYWTHPVAVAQNVAPFVSDEGVEAAYLHDVLEDTNISEATLRQFFSPLTVDYVVGLTKISKSEDGPRAVRKAKDLAFLAKQCAEVQTIKCADIEHNVLDIIKADPGFARTYLPEKAALLAVLTKAHPIMRNRALAAVNKGLEYLENQDPQ